MKTLLPVSILTAGMAYGLFNLFFASAADGETGSVADGAFSFAFAPGAVAYANIPARRAAGGKAVHLHTGIMN